jgi:hypothetical protein
MVFCLFDHILEGDLGTEFFLVLDENSPRKAQFYVDRRILHVRQNTLGVFSIKVYIL